MKMFMLMDVMLGKQAYFDSVPTWTRKLQSAGLDRAANAAMLQYLDQMLHRDV